jgi:putative acetyltransferase
MMQISVRPETPHDHQVIYGITQRAFASMPFASGDEQILINNLRDAGALSISLVAEVNAHVRGHVAFSPARAADGTHPWYALGPIAVEPTFQRRGIGTALINAGIRLLQERNAQGCTLVGDTNYYPRFGFQSFPAICPPTEPPEYFMILPMRTKTPTAVITFHPLFYPPQV